MPTMTGTSQETQTGAPLTTSVPATVASTPISEPTETSILPVMITSDMPIAATAM